MISKIRQIIVWIFFKIFRQPFKFVQGEYPNIFLYSSRRGGSTFLTEIIGEEPGMLAVHHPDGLHDDGNSIQAVTKRKHLPKPFQYQFITLNDSDFEKVFIFFNEILNGNFPQLSKPTFKNKSRIIFKLTDSFTLIDFYHDVFNCQTIYLIRHPIAQALSVTKNNWSINAAAYLENPEFSSKYLSDDQIRFGNEILKNGTYLEQAVLNWVLENYYPLKFAQKIDIRLTYEELALYPEKIISYIAKKFHLNNIPGMLERISIPSNKSQDFSDKKTRNAIKADEKYYLIDKWKKKISIQDTERCENILQIFNISEYSINSCFPDKSLLITGEFLPEYLDSNS